MNNKLILSTIIAVMFTISIVSAFGVSSPYWKGGESLKLYPGESRTILLDVQNMAPGVTEDVLATLEIVEGGSIVSLSKSEVLVKANESVNVPVVVRVSSDSAIGTESVVKIMTKTVAPGQSGGVGLSSGMMTEFSVVVVEKPQTAGGGNVMIIVAALAIVILLAVIIYVLSRKKRK